MPHAAPTHESNEQLTPFSCFALRRLKTINSVKHVAKARKHRAIAVSVAASQYNFTLLTLGPFGSLYATTDVT